MGTGSAAALAVFAGVLVAVQAVALGIVGRSVHPVTAALWVQLLGVVVAAAVVALAPVPFAAVGGTWPWAALAGACTVGIVASVGLTVGTLGVGTLLATVTGAQLLLAFALDAFGVAGRAVAPTPARLAGAALIVVGVLLVFDRTPPA